MFRKILVGFDGTRQSIKALETAITLAEIHGAKVKVVEALPMSYPVELYADEEIRDKERVIRHKEIIREISRNKGVEVEYEPIRGDAAAVISDIAEREDFDLVVVGNRGLKGFRKLVSYSVSSKLVETSRKLVLVVKE
ncbi:universal stress protein [Sulfuracidifex metallicus]|uniref:universal stress protein n=1 Tax=Sulfuracidifex metallicus TaxID=47303 RepID=UPI0022744A0E|nr:universal stress protein [Sulfuracidifex metallicus]MCY0849681.1 universal stress protein [Sulfuracidifex metallicus]